VILHPTVKLFYGALYRLSISNVKDVAGNKITLYKYPFTTTDEVIHKGIAYKVVTSPYTDKQWLDRNLGATQVCTAFNDTACYGDYYQWGRDADGHEESTSGTTTTQATNIDNVGHANFITADDTNDYDWAKTVDNNGSLRQANWSKIDGTSVCPSGFRMPTIEELRTELLEAGSDQIQNRDDAFSNFLKLPAAGKHSYFDGAMYDVGSLGDVWSSSISGSYASHLYFSATAAGDLNYGYRAYGLSVRCLRD